MSRWRNIVFGVLVFLIFICGLISGGFYYALWFSPALQEQFTAKIGELYGEKFWLPALSLLAGQVVLLLIACILSLDSQRQRRPYWRLYLGGFGVALPGLALYAGSLADLFRPEVLLGLGVATLLLPASVFGLEWLAGRLFIALGKVAYNLQLPAVSQPLLHLARCFLPRDLLAKKLYALSLFQNQRLEPAERLLTEVYQTEQVKTIEVLTALHSLAEQKDDLQKSAEFLEQLHKLEPEVERWRQLLIEVMEKLGNYRRAAQLLEEKPDYRQLNFLVRLQRLYTEFDLNKAREVSLKLAELEGKPYSQSLMAIRQLLRKVPDDIELLQAAAELCLKASYPEEAAEYLEQILIHQPFRHDIRQRLITIYREGLHYPKLRHHLELLVNEAGVVSADLMAEYIDSLIHSDEHETAEQLLLQAKETFPVDHRFPQMLAMLYYEKQRYEDALRELTAALALVVEDKTGQLSVLKNKIQGALLNRELEEIRQQVEAHPDDVDLRFKFIEKLTANAYVEKAAAELDQLLYFRPELKEQAMEHLTRLCESYDRTFLLLKYLADLYLKDKNYAKVLDLYQIMAKQSLHPEQVLIEGCKKILTLKNDFEPAWRCLGEQLYKIKNWSEAEAAYQHCLQFNPPDSGQIYLRLFDIYWQQGEFEKLVAIAEPAINAEPFNLENYKRVARGLLRLERFREALHWLMQAKNLDPRDEELFKLIRQADDRNKEERLLQLKHLVEKFPDNAEYHYELAELATHFERWNEAILHYQKAAQNPLYNNLCKAKLALCLAKKELYDLAEETLQEVKLTLENEDETREIKSAIYDIAAEFERVKLKDKALKYYKEVFRVDAGFRNVVEKIERLQASPFPWGKV